MYVKGAKNKMIKRGARSKNETTRYKIMGKTFLLGSRRVRRNHNIIFLTSELRILNNCQMPVYWNPKIYPREREFLGLIFMLPKM
jgi:hypothetical protein